MTKNLILNPRIVRTLSIIRQLGLGKVLKLDSGASVAMARNLNIGLVMEDAGTGEIYVSPLSDLSFRDLDELCERYKIGPII